MAATGNRRIMSMNLRLARRRQDRVKIAHAFACNFNLTALF